MQTEPKACNDIVEAGLYVEGTQKESGGSG